jgi:DNA-binding IclR family transcriptional regulator
LSRPAVPKANAEAPLREGTPVSPKAGEPTAGAQSIRRSLAILRIVASGQESGVRLVDVCNALGLNRPTVHRILRVLVEEGAVEKDAESHRYLIGREVSLLGLARIARFPIRAIAEPHLRELAQALGDTIFLTIRNGDDSVCLAREPGSYPIKVLSIEVGARRPLGVGVAGLVLLGDLPADEIRGIVQRNASRLRALKLEPATIAARARRADAAGHAYVAAGVVPGTSAVAVPVRHPDGRVLAALALTAIRDRLMEGAVRDRVAAMEKHAQAIGKAWALRQRR